MNLEQHKSVKELIRKFENDEHNEIEDDSEPENVDINNNLDDDSEWYKEIERGFTDDSDNDEYFSNTDNEFSDDNSDDNLNKFTNKNSRLALRPQTEIHSCRNVHIAKFYSKNNYTDYENNKLIPSMSSSSSTSTSLSTDSDTLAPIIDELISTEENFVKNLRFGFENYSKIFDEENLDELPQLLIGKEDELFRNVKDILEFHENEFLPMLLKEMYDYKTLFEKISEFVDENKFYSHLMYNMNKKGATKLCSENREFFKEFELKIHDRLGIINFLMQPIIRLTKYPLLLKEIIKKCFKNFEDKLILRACCIAEKKLSDFLTVVNESEQVNDIEECENINISRQGRFKKVNTFHIYNKRSECDYPGKVFLFEKSLIYTEIVDKSLIYRGYYPFENLGISIKDSEFKIYFNRPGIQENIFTAETSKIKIWTKLIRANLKEFFLVTKIMKNRKLIDSEKADISYTLEDDSEWFKEIERGFSDDEFYDSDNNFSNTENEFSEDFNEVPSKDFNEVTSENEFSEDFNEVTSKNFPNKPVLRSNTAVHSDRKNHTAKFYSEQIEMPTSSSSSSASCSSSSTTLSTDSDILAPIIDELISTEKNFIKNIKFGLENYIKIFEDENLEELPKSLIGKQHVLFRNIEDILEFHENEFLPMLLKEMYDYKTLFEKISEFVDENKFYSHLMYNMNKKGASKLCNENREFFKNFELTIGDKLGVISFLMQPVIRLTKYPLLLKEIMKKCFKNFDDKLILQSCCIAEKKLSDFLTFVNESEQVNDIEGCDNVDISMQGRFKKVDTFHIYNKILERGYRGKVFLFEKSIIYAEIVNNTLIFRGYYPFENLGINVKDNQFTVYFNKPGDQECIFGADKSKIDVWTKLIRDYLKEFFLASRRRTLKI